MWLPEQVMQSSGRAWIDSQAPSHDGWRIQSRLRAFPEPLTGQLKGWESAPFQCLTLMDGAAMAGWDNGKAEHCQGSWAGSSRKELPSVHGVNTGGEGSCRGCVQSYGHQEKAVPSPCDLGVFWRIPRNKCSGFWHVRVNGLEKTPGFLCLSFRTAGSSGMLRDSLSPGPQFGSIKRPHLEQIAGNFLSSQG